MSSELSDAARNALAFALVGVLWGCTNPLIKRSSAGIENIKAETAIGQSLAEFKFLVTNWQYLGSLLLNQAGSVLYFVALADAEISLAVPVANSLTFIFTGLMGSLLGERFGSLEAYAGIALVVLGVAMCVHSKLAD